MNYRNTMIAVLLAATLLFSLFTVFVASGEGLTLSAKSATLYEPSTRSFLFEKNSSVRLPMASTTKIMTALVALENAKLKDTVIIDERSHGIEGSSAYLSLGDRYTLEEMLYALMLSSANDAAVAIACTVGGSVEGFVDLMNQKCEELSLCDTHFKNPSGLDADEHYTTANDLARLTAHALENAVFRELCSTYKRTIGEQESTRHLVNHNKLLKQYPDAIGVKTGYTKKCGRCLVSAAERDGVTLVAVTLDAPNDWQDHKRLLDFGFDSVELKEIAKIGEFDFKIPVTFTENGYITAKNERSIKIPLRKGADVSYDVQLPQYITPPVKVGDVVGKVKFSIDGNYACELDIICKYINITEEKQSLFSKLFRKNNNFGD